MEKREMKVEFLERGVKIDGCVTIDELWSARDAIEILIASLLYELEKGYFEKKEEEVK